MNLIFEKGRGKVSYRQIERRGKALYCFFVTYYVLGSGKLMFKYYRSVIKSGTTSNFCVARNFLKNLISAKFGCLEKSGSCRSLGNS
jgi:hypothetical protein